MINKLSIKWTYFLLLCIVLISVFLRVYRLGDTPVGFHQDEVVNTYVGKYILTNGFDIHGISWPLLYFDKKGDYPPVIPMYISALGTYMFGLTILGSRIIIALISALIVIPIYGISFLLVKKRVPALFSALLGSITPWLISYSRVSAEGILATTIATIGLWFLITSLQSKSRIILSLGILSLGSTYFLYPGYRILVPLILLSTCIVYFSDILQNWKQSMNKIFIILFICSILGSFVLSYGIGKTTWGIGRFNQTSILSSQNIDQGRIDQFIFNENSIVIAKFFNNKTIYISREFIKQYLSYFSPVFLFVEGGLPIWYAVPNSGLLYFGSFLLLISIVFLYSTKRHSIDFRVWILLLLLLLIAPLPSALTNELTPNTHRSMFMPIILICISSYGFYLLSFVKIKRFPIIVVPLFIICLEFIFFYHNYFQHISMYTNLYRGDGNIQVAKYISDHHYEYNTIHVFISGWFPVYYLYADKNFDKSLPNKFNEHLRMSSFQNIIFKDNDCEESLQFIPNDIRSNKSDLLIVHGGCPIKNESLRYLESIKNISGINIFDIYQIDSSVKIQYK
ncbi:MAG: hypothetical protein WCO06_03325 [Candidatus Roizmanbacteria bacterium]